MEIYLNFTKINLEYLENCSAGNKQFIIEILEIYKTDMPLEFEKLKKAIHAKDYNVIVDIAHKMKNNTKLCNVEPLSELLETLEVNINNKITNLDFENILIELEQSLNDSLILIEDSKNELCIN